MSLWPALSARRLTERARLATTPGLHVAESVSFDSYTKPPKRSSKKRQDDTALRNLLLHSSAHGTMEYTGKEDGAAASLVKHYIGLFDPVSGQLQAVEARRLVIRGSVRQHRAPAEAMAAWTAMQVRHRFPWRWPRPSC